MGISDYKQTRLRLRLSIMVSLMLIGCVTSYGKNSNLMSFSDFYTVYLR